MIEQPNLDRAKQMMLIARQRKVAAENALMQARDAHSRAQLALEAAQNKQWKCEATVEQAKIDINRNPVEEQRHIWLKKCAADLEAAQAKKADREYEVSECEAAVAEAQAVLRKLTAKHDALKEHAEQLEKQYRLRKAEKADEEQLENSGSNVHSILEATS